MTDQQEEICRHCQVSRYSVGRSLTCPQSEMRFHAWTTRAEFARSAGQIAARWLQRQSAKELTYR